MRFLVLGPLEVTDDGGKPLALSGAKERTILADLIAHSGHVVSVDDLIDEVWGEDPPRTAEKTLGSYVSRLRGALQPGRDAGAASDVITTLGDGYRLEINDVHEIDALRFEQLAEEGRRLLDAGQPKDASTVLEQALGLWRGTAYQGYRYTGFGTSEGERLEELRRSAAEDWIDTRLAAGDAASSIADLESMVHEQPLRERRWGQLMLALYRAGRQAEALQAFTRARTVLVDDLAVEPGPDLQRLHAAILAQDPTLERRWPRALAGAIRPTDVCPYKGLARFETSDAEFYFGREHLVAEAVGRLVVGRFLALVGSSGSGKSSLLRAGLLHALGSGAVPGSDGWTYAVIRPGEHPLAELTRAMNDRRDAEHLVLAIDQFEETFTACTDNDERTRFLDAITDAGLVPEGAVTVVLAMRADYYGPCAEHRALASLLATSQILVGPMNEAELRRAIELPAERTDLTLEDPLTDSLVADTVNQPGGLPLLSTALLELWTHRRDRTLRLDDYLRSGGVEGAVARLAEDAYSKLDGESQAAAKRILIRLAGSGHGSEVVRRRATLSEFDLEQGAAASRALAALTTARLVTVADGTAEVAHEALLRDWPRLRTWLEDDAEGRRLHENLTASAHAWEETGRDDGDLYRGARLAAALDWGDAHEPDLNTWEREFLVASRAAWEGEADRARRTNRLLRGLLAGVALFLVLSLIIGNLAIRQRDEAQAAANIADSRQLATRSLTEKDGIVQLLLAREAVALDDSPQTRGALLTALQRDPAAIAVMHASGATPGDPTQWLRLSPDGHIIATGGARPTVELFDATTYRPLRDIDVGAATTAGDFSLDGATLAVATVDRRIVGIDVNARTVRASRSTTGREIDAILFAPQGGRLLTAESNRKVTFLVPRDPVTFAPSGNPVRSETGPISAMAASGDGRWLATTSLPPTGLRGYTTLWREPGLRQVGDVLPMGGNDIALSPDGRIAAIAIAQNSNSSEVDDLEGHLVFLNLLTGRRRSKEAREPGRGGGIGLTGVGFASDGRTVISTGDDHRVLIWDASSASIEQEFSDPAGLLVLTPALSPDGQTAFSIDVDGNVVAWDLTGDRRIGRSFTAGFGAMLKNGVNAFPYFAVSPDGTTLAITQICCAHRTADIRLVDTSTLATRAVIPYDRYGTGYFLNDVFSPDSKTLAVSSSDGYVQLWDVRTGTAAGPPFRDPTAEGVYFWAPPAFSPDGSILATASDESGSRGGVFLWGVATGRLLGRLPARQHPVATVNFTPDGARLITSTSDSGDVTVWNVDDHHVVSTFPTDNTGVWWADLSKDGATLVTSGRSGRETLWDLANGEPIGPALDGPLGPVDLSPDGRTLVAAGGNHVVTWDVETGSVLGRAWFPGVGSKEGLAASFTPDGRWLFIISATGDAWVWDVDPTSWETRACQIAGRGLTEAEWQANLPDRPYDPVCGS